MGWSWEPGTCISLHCVPHSPKQAPPGTSLGIHHGSSPRSRWEITSGLQTGGPACREEAVCVVLCAVVPQGRAVRASTESCMPSPGTGGSYMQNPN